MDKKSVLEDIKEEIAILNEKMDYDNYGQTQGMIQKYLKLLNLVAELPFDNTAHIDRVRSNGSVEDVSLKEIYDTKNNVFIGKLELQLGGGQIGSFKIFIPETQIRRLDVEDGDWIKATALHEEKIKGKIRTVYNYELIQKSKEPIDTKRKVIKYANLEYDDILQTYYITSTYQGGLPLRIMLKEYKLNNLPVKEGDLIDYAYWADDILDGRVIWHHDTYIDITISPKKSNFYKDNTDLENEEIEPIFEGIKIAVVGFESKKNSFEDAVIRRNGEFVFFTGDENLTTLQRDLSTSDIIILFIESIGHSGMYKVRDISKEHQIPIIYTRHIGRTSFIEIICDKLNLENAAKIT